MAVDAGDDSDLARSLREAAAELTRYADALEKDAVREDLRDVSATVDRSLRHLKTRLRRRVSAASAASVTSVTSIRSEGSDDTLILDDTDSTERKGFLKCVNIDKLMEPDKLALVRPTEPPEPKSVALDTESSRSKRGVRVPVRERRIPRPPDPDSSDHLAVKQLRVLLTRLPECKLQLRRLLNDNGIASLYDCARQRTVLERQSPPPPPPSKKRIKDTSAIQINIISDSDDEKDRSEPKNKRASDRNLQKPERKKRLANGTVSDSSGDDNRSHDSASKNFQSSKHKKNTESERSAKKKQSDSDSDIQIPKRTKTGSKFNKNCLVSDSSEDGLENGDRDNIPNHQKTETTDHEKSDNISETQKLDKRKLFTPSPTENVKKSDSDDNDNLFNVLTKGSSDHCSSGSDTDSDTPSLKMKVKSMNSVKKVDVESAAQAPQDSSAEESDASDTKRENHDSDGVDSDSKMSKKLTEKQSSENLQSDEDENASGGEKVQLSDSNETDKEDQEKSAAAKEETLGGTDSNDSEVFKPTKRKRKKKKSSGESSDESPEKKQKKRRRIKNMSGDDSDKSRDNSDSEEEAESKKHGRKNIRKVKKSVTLDEATRVAARKEKERMQRIAERQKLYNESMFDESGRPDEVKKLEKVDLDFDPDTKQPIISVDKGLVRKLKPHQANGIKFMWDACFESIKQINDTKGSGCILAHCMGLGKTLQVVTLVHTLLTNQKLTKVERVLVVCPLSTVLNWVNEFNMWLKFAKCKDDFEIFEISRYKQNYERASKLKEWCESGGVCVLGYDMFRNLSADNNKKFKKAQLATFQKALVDPGPDLVVCDEGHLLKNEKTSLSQSMNKVKTLRRIVLTGTPLQNNLKEYYCMVQFVKPNLLGKYNEYLNRFVNPITNGQYTDSTEHDIRVMKRRSHVLHKMLDGAVQRRDYAVLAPFLPPKNEYVLFISLTDIQIKLYSHYIENFSRRPQPDRKSTGFLFPDFQNLQRIWTHPLVMKANSERYEIMQQKKREKEEDSEGSLADFIDDDDDDTTTPDETSSSDDDSLDSDASDQPLKKKKGKNKKPLKRVTRATVVDSDEEVEKPEEKPEEPRQDNPTDWWMSLCSEEELDDVRHSNKLILLLDILKMCEAIGDKVLVFSQSLYSLDLIEQFLWKIDEATQSNENSERLGGHMGSWSAGIDYFRLDGSTSCENRAIWCKNFNREDNPRARLFLISTRAGGLGINLVAANRVIIFDMSWNPSHDVQSIFRVYRFGQKKPCYIYRFLALGTMEEKIYERQVTKQAISKRVIDEQQIDRHYAEGDLAELYNFMPIPEGPREVPKLPKDRLFADLLKEHDTKIYKYHEHDSLLENKEEETLTEEERKAAWEDYENEKTRPPVAYGSSIFAGYQQQQQHHMAMSALLQRDYPGLSEQQIAGMVPMFLQQMYQNGDSTLMQKMNSMITAQNSLMGYKYPQANTAMNPEMMLNPNNMTANAGGVGNSSYLPMWQQQQQLQLQRLQQQQMQSNLKFYAGGLGSRDTMDMAALQERQRAMMMTNSSTMPQRGRPPKNRNMVFPMPVMPMPNPIPPATTGEVVDLDSE